MQRKTRRLPTLQLSAALVALLGALLACSRAITPDDAAAWQVPGSSAGSATLQPTFTPFPWLPPTRVPGAPIFTPTPDRPHDLPSLRTSEEQYVVQPGDTLGRIAQGYGVSLEQLVSANNLVNPNLLEVGQVLLIPAPEPDYVGSDFKIIPDAELVHGPGSALMDIPAFVHSQSGYLAAYSEEVDGQEMSGVEIVRRVALEFSVNPRLLLAVLEYQSGWVTSPTPDDNTKEYPIGVIESRRRGLYRQLAFAADNLNLGYYGWRVNAVSSWTLFDGSVVPVNATINAGTAGVQQFFARLYGREGWDRAVAQDGLFATYQRLFGYPFDFAIEPLIPPGLQQPVMQLPIEPGREWAFTGGPHGGWGDGSAWAAVDFAPPGDQLGCIASNDWVVAVADGVIVRSGGGAVVQDLDDDGYEQTGWAVLYMHIESRDRVPLGTRLKAGQRIGHPSCEGGISSGTHVHVARKYNGEWIPADQTMPFIMDGWVSRGAGKQYDGYLEKDGRSIEAWEGRGENLIVR